MTLVGYHSFMAAGCVDDMTWARSLEDFRCAPLLYVVRWSGECDRLSGQRGVDLVHTLYTDGSWTCIWSLMRPNVLRDMTYGKIIGFSFRWVGRLRQVELSWVFSVPHPLFLVTPVHAPRRCSRHDERVTQARRPPWSDRHGLKVCGTATRQKLNIVAAQGRFTASVWTDIRKCVDTRTRV
jgi:hypothetical protein